MSIDRRMPLAGLGAVVAGRAQAQGPTARGPRGLQTGLGGSINVETIEFLGARNVTGGFRGGLANVSLEPPRRTSYPL